MKPLIQTGLADLPVSGVYDLRFCRIGSLIWLQWTHLTGWKKHLLGGWLLVPAKTRHHVKFQNPAA